jgi:hypothetical protein
VQRLVELQHQVAAQHGKRLRVAGDALADRQRELLRAGLSEQQLSKLIEQHKGSAVSVGDKEKLARSLQLLLGAGLSPDQIASCLRFDILAGDPADMAAAVSWLRDKLSCNDSQLVRTIHKAPWLLNYSPAALDARLEWWQQLASTPAQWTTLITTLRTNPDVLIISPGTLGCAAYPTPLATWLINLCLVQLTSAPHCTSSACPCAAL